MLAAVALLGSGCGTAEHSNGRLKAAAVINAWANALRRGDVRGAAHYFALPSVFANGPGPYGAPAIAIHDAMDALQVNESLPCGAKLISATPRGRYVDALFLLTGRPGPGGTTCGSGAGQHASVDFHISSGKIVAWIRLDAEGAPPPPEPITPPIAGGAPD